MEVTVWREEGECGRTTGSFRGRGEELAVVLGRVRSGSEVVQGRRRVAGGREGGRKEGRRSLGWRLRAEGEEESGSGSLVATGRGFCLGSWSG